MLPHVSFCAGLKIPVINPSEKKNLQTEKSQLQQNRAKEKEWGLLN